MVGVFVAFIRVVYGRMIHMSLPKLSWSTLPAISNAYRNLTLLPTASWNPELSWSRLASSSIEHI